MLAQTYKFRHLMILSDSPAVCVYPVCVYPGLSGNDVRLLIFNSSSSMRMPLQHMEGEDLTLRGTREKTIISI